MRTLLLLLLLVAVPITLRGEDLVIRDLNILEKRAQTAAQLSQRGSSACHKAQELLEKGWAQLTGFSSMVRAAQMMEQQIQEEVEEMESQVKDANLWSGTLERSSKALAKERDRAGALAKEICTLAEQQQEERAAQIDALIVEIEGVAAEASGEYETLQRLFQQVDVAWAALTEIRADIAQLNVTIDAAHAEQSRVDLVLQAVQMQRGMAGDDFSELFNLVESAPIFYDSAIYQIEKRPEEYDPSVRERLDQAMAAVRAEGEGGAECLDALQESIGAFTKKYEEEQERLAAISGRKKVLPGALQRFGELRKQVDGSREVVQMFKENIDHYVAQARLCGAQVEDWSGALQEVIEALEGATQ